jgi:hypothetical protein
MDRALIELALKWVNRVRGADAVMSDAVVRLA